MTIDAFATATALLAALRTKHVRFATLVGAELGGFTRPRGYDAD